VAGGGVERAAAGQSLPAGVAPEGAAKAAGPSVTAARSPGPKANRPSRLPGDLDAVASLTFRMMIIIFTHEDDKHHPH